MVSVEDPVREPLLVSVEDPVREPFLVSVENFEKLVKRLGPSDNSKNSRFFFTFLMKKNDFCIGKSIFQTKINKFNIFHETIPRLFATVGCAPLGSKNQPLVLKPNSWTS